MSSYREEQELQVTYFKGIFGQIEPQPGLQRWIRFLSVTGRTVQSKKGVDDSYRLRYSDDNYRRWHA